jgi:peptidyl-prolyl cis-trans isomerase-like 4
LTLHLYFSLHVCTRSRPASQFFLTLRDGIDFLDGKHTIFGSLGEGFDVLDKINAAIVDEHHRPLKNIRIRHTVVLDDPFPDPPALAALVPPQSPKRVEDVFDEDYVDPEEQAAAADGTVRPRSDAEIERSIQDKQAKTRAVMLEMVLYWTHATCGLAMPFASIALSCRKS